MFLFMNKPKENCPKVTVRVNPSELTLMKTYLFYYIVSIIILKITGECIALHYTLWVDSIWLHS